MASSCPLTRAGVQDAVCGGEPGLGGSLRHAADGEAAAARARHPLHSADRPQLVQRRAAPRSNVQRRLLHHHRVCSRAGELGEAMEIPLATVARSKTKDDGPGGAAEEAEANAKAAAPAPAPAQAAVPPQTAAAASANKAGEKGEGEAKGAEEAASKKRRIIPKV
eukprot:2774165-Rhodomonas_salina.1